MNPILKKSWPARISAIGFILVILAGNAWLGMAMIGSQAPDAVSLLFAAGVIISLGGGLGLAALALKLRLAGESPDEGDDVDPPTTEPAQGGRR